MKLVQPQLEELKYRKKLLKDKKTMAFNKSNGGIVDFNENLKPWYALWMNDSKALLCLFMMKHSINILVKYLIILKKNIKNMF